MPKMKTCTEDRNDVPALCKHEWEELTRHKVRNEPGMVCGHQQCRKCGKQSYYNKEADEE
jgi:hypothetical protein